MILTGYRANGVELYTPKPNRKKQLALVGFAGVCLATPGTNWLMAVAAKLITKFNPIWIYQ